MADRVELAFRRAADRLIPEEEGLLVGVSGGGDSVALLHLLSSFAERRRWRIVVGHLDHGLRRGSRADRRFVEGLSRSLGHPCAADRRDVDDLRRKDESPEEAARRVRRGFLREAARAERCRLIVTGHTLDDQAETVLMRLVRGAGATALTGMAERGPGPFVRPLLGVERVRLRDYLDRRGLPFREDPTNHDLRFDRNRVRRVVLPFLSESLNAGAARNLVRASRRFREDAEYLDAAAEAAFETVARQDRLRRWSIDAARLLELPPPLARRLARLALQRAGSDARRIGSHHIEALLDLARGGGGRSVHLPGRMSARRVKGRVVLGKN